MPTVDEILKSIKPQGSTAEDYTTSIPYTQMDTRYPNQFIGLDNEDLYGQNQTTGEKWKNAAVKFGATAGTTFLEGTVGLVNGVYQGLKTGEFSSFYDNDLNKNLSAFTDGLEKTNPTYYTNQEKNAAWYSPDTWATANFWSDTIFKNSGFAVGALASGLAWGKVFSAVGKTAQLLSQGGKTAAEALEIANAADSALLTRSGSALGDLNTTIDGIASELSTSQEAMQWVKNMTPSAKNLVRSITAASGEAQIEAFHAKDTYLTQMKQDYLGQFGQEATGETLRQLEDTASKVGNTVFGANMALLTGTNLIQFPKIMGKAWGSSKSALSDIERTTGRMVVKDAEGNIIARQGLFGAKPIANLAEGETYAASKATSYLGDQLERVRAGRILNRTSKYARILFSPSEAIEEGTQSIIPVSAQDYFDKGSDTKGDLWASVKKGIATELKDKDFFISVLSGGITGALMERGHTFKADNAQRVQTKGVAQQFNEGTYTPPSYNQTIDGLKNSVLGNHMHEVSRSLNRQERLSSEASQALMNNDRLTYEDKKTDQWLNYLLPRIQYGRQDIVRQDVQGWKEVASTEEGWNQLLKDGKVTEDMDREEFVSNMDKLESLIGTTTTHFANLNRRYADLKNQDGTLKYTQNNLLKLAYIGSKIDDYNKRLNDLSGEVGNRGIEVMTLIGTLSAKVSDDLDFEGQKSLTDKIQEYADQIKSQLDNRTDLTIEEKEDIFEQLGDIAELSARRNMKVTEYETYRDNPQAFDDTEKQDREADEVVAEDEVVEPATQTPKQSFFESQKGQQFQLNFGRRGIQVGELQFDPKTNILSLKTDQGTYEVTNQDFKDGLITKVGGVIEDEAFLNYVDERTEVKRRNTRNQISLLQKAKQERINQVNQEVSNLEVKVSDLRSRIDTSTNKEVLDTLVGIHDSAQNQLAALEEERNDLLDHLGIYQDILDGNTFDYAMVLNDVESLMDITQNQLASLDQNAASLRSLLKDVKDSIKYWTGILRSKIAIRERNDPNNFNLTAVGNLVDKFSETDNLRMDMMQDIITKLNDENLQPSKAQRDKLEFQLAQIQEELDKLKRENQAREQVYAEMLNTVLKVENPISPEDFVTQGEAETIVEEEEEPIEEGLSEEATVTKLFAIKAKKLLRNWFTSTKAMQNGNQEPWFTRYNNGVKAIVKLPASERNKLRTILVTANNEAALGAEGLIDQMFLKEGRLPYYKSKEAALDPMKGALAAIIVSEDADGTRYFIGEDGRRIGKVGEKIDPKKTIGSIMGVPKLEWSDGTNGYIKPESSSYQPQELLDMYKAERARIFSDTSASPASYKFSFSKGIQKGLEKENRIVGNLVNREDAGKEGLLQIVQKSDVITLPNGEQHTAKAKFVMLQTEDVQAPLTPRKFNEKYAKDFAQAYKKFVILSQVADGNSKSLAHYIKTMLPYNVKLTKEGLQLNSGVTISNEVFRTGTEVEQAKALDQIQSYLLTRNIKIANDLQQPFTEYYTDAGGNLISRDWNTYQEFLISNEYGTDPRGNESILSTSQSQESQENKYILLQGFLETPINTPTGTETTEEATIIPEQVQARVRAYDSILDLEGTKPENILHFRQGMKNVVTLLVDWDVKQDYMKQNALAKQLGSYRFPHILKEIAKGFQDENGKDIIVDTRGLDLSKGALAVIDELNGVTPEQKAAQHSQAIRQQFADLISKELKGKKNKQVLLDAAMNLLEDAAVQSGDVNAFYGKYQNVTADQAKEFKAPLISNLEAIIKNDGGTVKVDGGSFEVDIFEGTYEITDVKGTIPEEVYQELRNRLPQVEISPVTQLVTRLKETGLASEVVFQTMDNPDVMGYVEGSTVYLNKDKLDSSSALHEFGHLFNQFIKEVRPEIYQRGLELIQTEEGKPYIDFVKRNQPNLEGEALNEEALTEAIGDQGAKLIGKSPLKGWLAELWQTIKDLLGITEYTPEQLANITLKEFTRATAKTLLSGEELGVSSVEGQSFQIIGEVGAENDRLMQANLDLAKRMLEEGDDARTIKYATGWEFNEQEQKWKAETDDTFDIPEIKDGLLEDVLTNADELFRLYPSLREVELHVINDEDEYLAAVDENGIWLNERTIKELEGNYKANIKENLIHEVEHLIQQIEGFENGGTQATNEISDLSNYLNLAGEVEARNAANRSQMSMEERNETLLSDTEDVAMEDKIYTGTPSSIAKLVVDNSTKLISAIKNDDIQAYSALFGIPTTQSSFQSFIQDANPEITQENINNAELAHEISLVSDNYAQESSRFLDRVQNLENNLFEISVSLQEYLDDPQSYEYLNPLNKIQPEGLPVIEASCI